MKPIVRKSLKYVAVVSWLITVVSALCLAVVYVFEYLKTAHISARKVFKILRLVLDL